MKINISKANQAVGRAQTRDKRLTEEEVRRAHKEALERLIEALTAKRAVLRESLEEGDEYVVYLDSRLNALFSEWMALQSK